ncbi:hypothetical protein IFM89_038161 [Coptis chinensis]|uniref:Uncharacterized protein n=1 Tax=Coptis chinensis TaxID=261450 RepID=A0A835LU57_9MAGN|nr:hypothetical protein IFM89_038161 [Coptis chinensis]
MHCRSWRSIYCMPKRPAFKGSAPINLSDRLNQVLHWALGYVEIFFSCHRPILYGYKGGNLRCLEHLSYINTTVYPFTSLPLLSYCTLPAICLLTGKFIMPTSWNMEFVDTGKLNTRALEDTGFKLKAEVLVTAALREKLFTKDLEINQLRAELATASRGS